MVRMLIVTILLSSFTVLAQDTVLIENVTIISSHLREPKQNMNVLIDDGRIAKITKSKITTYDSSVDGSGKFLTPGIMDSHAHVSSIPGMGFGVEPVSRKHPKLAEAYFEQQPNSFLYYGVTQVLDPNPGLNFNHFISATNHPDYFRCEVITSEQTFPYVEKKDRKSRSMFTYLIDEKALKNEARSAERVVQKIAQSGASCIKLYFEDGYGNASHWPLLKPQTIQRIKASAEQQNLPILAHANALDMQQLAMAAGVDVIAHGMWNWGQYSREQNISEEIAQLLEDMISNKVGYMPTQRVIAGLGEVMRPSIADSVEFVSITPRALLDWYKTPQAQWFRQELRAGFDGMPDESIADVFLFGRTRKGSQIIHYLKESNYPILLASDFPGSPSFANQPGLTTFKEMHALSDAGLSHKEVLAAATINNAKQFKIDNDYGTVEVGKIANLLLLDSNPLRSIEAWDSIDLIFLHGRPIKRQSLMVKNNE